MVITPDRLTCRVFANQSREITVNLWSGMPFKATLFDKLEGRIVKTVDISRVGDFQFYWGTNGIMAKLESWLKQFKRG